VHAALVAQGRRWGQHIVETPVAWLLSAVYIFGTVISGWPLFTAIRRGIAAGQRAAGVAMGIEPKLALNGDQLICNMCGHSR
jgi:hypothetical protein